MKEEIYSLGCKFLAYALFISVIIGYTEVVVRDNRILESENESYRLEREIESLKEDKEELRNKLTEAEMDYISLSTLYYASKESNIKMSEEVEEMRVTLASVDGHEMISVTLDELDLLSRCCSAEAGETNYESQKAIAQVILNRVNSPLFPDSISDVIHQDGQFKVVDNGAINKRASNQTFYNVLDVVINGYAMPSDVVYFHRDTGAKSYKVIEGTAFCR